MPRDNQPHASGEARDQSESAVNRRDVLKTAAGGLVAGGLGVTATGTVSAQSTSGPPFKMPNNDTLGWSANRSYGVHPAAMAFDSQNRPYMVNIEGTTGDTVGHVLAYRNGGWTELDYTSALDSAGVSYDLNRKDNRERAWMAIDDDDDIYVAHQTIGTSSGGWEPCVLLYTSDFGSNWQVWEWNHKMMLEVNNGNNDTSVPPIIGHWDNAGDGSNYVEVWVPEKNNGQLDLGNPIEITSSALGYSTHSGGHQWAVTNNSTEAFVAYAEEASDNPQYVARVDRQNKTVTDRVYVDNSTNQNGANRHCSPTMVKDYNGYIHYLVGTQNNNFKYYRSAQPGSITDGWTDYELTGSNQSTYASLVCDDQNRLHNVWHKNRNDPGDVYQRRDSGSWNSGELFLEPPDDYSTGDYEAYYQRAFADRDGGAIYYSFQFYHRGISDSANNYPRQLVVSTDGGQTWSPATTSGFQNRVNSSGAPTADAGADQTVTDSDGDGSESVTLDGSGSSDDGSISSYEWTENGSQIATGETPSVNLGLGIHDITLTVTDNDNNTDTDTVTVTVTDSDGQAPYADSPWAIPTRIQAEDFDEGGEGVAYHDDDTANNGGAYRTDGVDIETTGDSSGTYNVGWINADEWLEYTVDVDSDGTYDLDLRVASPNDGNSMHVEMDGTDVTGSISIPNTGDWQTWQTVTVQDVSLTAGQQIMRLYFDTSGFNLNFVEWTDTSGGDSTAPTAPSNLSSPAHDASSVGLDWDASSDSGGSGLDHYNVYVDGAKDQEVSAGTTSATVSDLAAGTSYDFHVTAVDGASNESSDSNTVTQATDSLPGEVSRWTLDGTSASDSVGSNDGTINGSPTTGVSGQDGSAWDFDGSDDHVTVADDSSLNPNDLTLALWVKTSSLNSNDGSYMYSKFAWSDKAGYEIIDDGEYNDVVMWRVGGNGSAFDLRIPRADINDGNWHHLVGTKSGSDMTFYLDGVEVDSRTDAVLDDRSADVGIASTNGGSNLLDGSLDDIRLWDQGLTQDEVEGLYNSY